MRGRVFIGIIVAIAIPLAIGVGAIYLQLQSLKIDEKTDFSNVQVTLEKDKSQTNAEITKIRNALELLAEKTPNKDLVNRFLAEKINQRIGPLGKRLGDMQTKVDQQASIIRVYNPNQILAVVRSEVAFASENKKLPRAP